MLFNIQHVIICLKWAKSHFFGYISIFCSKKLCLALGIVLVLIWLCIVFFNFPVLVHIFLQQTCHSTPKSGQNCEFGHIFSCSLVPLIPQLDPNWTALKLLKVTPMIWTSAQIEPRMHKIKVYFLGQYWKTRIHWLVTQNLQ